MTENNAEKMIQMDKLARDVLVLSRNTLLVNLRFLDMALSRFTYVPSLYAYPVGTDGEVLAYNPKEVLLKYKQEKEEMTRCYLHMVFHCVFRHMFIHTLVNRDYWDLACDIAVEAVIDELGIRSTETKRSRQLQNALSEIRKKTKYLTAEKIYAFLIDSAPDDKELIRWNELFRQDHHYLWYMTEEEKDSALGRKRSSGQGKQSQAASGEQKDGNGEGEQQERSGEQNGGNSAGDQQESSANASEMEGGGTSAEEDWKAISERMQQDLETFSKQRGDTAGGLMQNLAALNRERYDYESFLKKFAVLGEKMKINDDEFDYVFYTYGLSLYKNMPLIEPLEYKEVKSIREFVIAIDTSGSVSGDEVQSFINKTYNIMKSTESFFSKINVHIIQCDTVIQEDAKITSQEEFDEYIKNMKLKGFGGTDFRPVFDYVDEMRRNHEFANLKGLIYFTDGYGVFPEKKPEYETAFVFVRDNYEIPEVPPWAIKLVLEPEDL